MGCTYATLKNQKTHIEQNNSFYKRTSGLEMCWEIYQFINSRIQIMSKIVKVKTGSIFEEKGSYSRLVAIDNWIYVSNTAGRNPKTKEISEDVVEQTNQVFANIEAALVSVGANLTDVVMSRVFIQNPEDTPQVMDLIGKKFKGINPATTVICPPLGSTIYKVELEVTAYRGASECELEEIKIS